MNFVNIDHVSYWLVGMNPWFIPMLHRLLLSRNDKRSPLRTFRKASVFLTGVCVQVHTFIYFLRENDEVGC